MDTPPPLRYADVLNGWSLSWHVPDGYLVAVVGAVGTGKSSLLSGNVNMVKVFHYKSVNLKYITVGRLDDDMIVPISDGAMFILIDRE